MKSFSLLTDSIEDTVSAIQGIANRRLIEDDRSVVMWFGNTLDGFVVYVTVFDLSAPGSYSMDDFVLADPLEDDNLSSAARRVDAAVMARGVATESERVL